MLIEDEPVIMEGLKTMVEDLIGGFTVCAEAAGGNEALNIIEQADPDIIITDIRMPGMDGLEAIKQIRNIKGDIPIVIVSGYAEFEYAKRAIEYNVSDYILKPVDRMEMAKALTGIGEKLNRDLKADNDENQIIRKVKQIIDDNLDQDISLTSIADKVFMNHQYLSKLFKEKTGINYSRYITGRRIEKAGKLLETTSLKVYEIAALCGYGGTKHFLSVFKKETGKTPGEYRNKGCL